MDILLQNHEWNFFQKQRVKLVHTSLKNCCPHYIHFHGKSILVIHSHMYSANQNKAMFKTALHIQRITEL